MLILGIESSCDDTACAVVEDGKRVLASKLASQVDVHKEFDGVVPELAARKHLEAISPLIDSVIKESGVTLKDIDAVAVTNRPGLIGSLLVGVSAAKGLAYALSIPLIPVDHLAAHIYSVHLSHEIELPYTALVVSGGHTLLCRVDGHGEYSVAGTTLDDAAGEAYDKVAKHFGLGYPGGPVIDKLAAQGREGIVKYSVTNLKGKDKYNFSFSGLKTAVIYQTQQFSKEGETAAQADIALAFQNSVVESLRRKTLLYVQDSGLKRVTLSGGVAANSELRRVFAEEQSFEAYIPERKYTSDNAAMVAGLAYHLYNKGERGGFDMECSSRVLNKREVKCV